MGKICHAVDSIDPPSSGHPIRRISTLNILFHTISYRAIVINSANLDDDDFCNIWIVFDVRFTGKDHLRLREITIYSGRSWISLYSMTCVAYLDFPYLDNNIAHDHTEIISTKQNHPTKWSYHWMEHSRTGSLTLACFINFLAKD